MRVARDELLNTAYSAATGGPFGRIEMFELRRKRLKTSAVDFTLLRNTKEVEDVIIALRREPSPTRQDGAATGPK